MNRREAKREACFLVGVLVESQLAVGWEAIEDRYEPADQERVENAVQEIAFELMRRGRI